MFKFIKRRKAQKQEEQERRQAQRKAEYEAEHRNAINARIHKSDQELRAEIEYYKQHIKEVDLDYKIRRAVGRMGRCAPLYHYLHKAPYHRIIGICKEILESRGATY